MGEKKYIQNFSQKPEGKRPLGRQRHRCKDNIKMSFKEIGCECMNWI